jgi:D-alanyl-D-alanine carboxypeptidase/D-alanyl-D-alanine-endopeptidase (penicillin-binding protein 4)
MYWRKKVQRMFSRKNVKRMFCRMKVQRTIRRTACLLTMTAASVAAIGQTTVDATKPEAVSAPLPSAQQPPLTLAQQIAALVADPAVARAHWGVIVTTLDGRPIYELNEAQLFQPASNAKLFTTAAAMALLPPTHVFTTTVTGNGLFMEDGTLHGSLELNGVGDANLSGRDLPYIPPALRPNPAPPANDPLRYLEEMADQVKAAGVKRVEGDIWGADFHFERERYPSGWSMDDAVWGYAAPVSGLSVADNEMKVTIYPSPAKGYEAFFTRLGEEFPALIQVDQVVPYYTVVNHVECWPEKKPTHIQIERTPGSHELLVYGYISRGAQPVVEEIAIDDPAAFAALTFKQMLVDRGIPVTGTAEASHALVYSPRVPTVDFATEANEPIANLAPLPESHEFPDVGSIGCPNCDKLWAYKVLAKHVSAPLREDIVVTNKESLNLHAELLLLQLGLAVTGKGERAQGVRIVRQFLINAGIDKDDFVFYDGSGLSGYDLVTPRAVAKLLSFAAHDPKTGAPQPWFADWKASLPVGGVDGTLADRFTAPPLKGHVFAKTGTHSEGRALSGYLECASGQTVIFSILVDHQLPGDSADRDAMDKIVAAIAAAE